MKSNQPEKRAAKAATKKAPTKKASTAALTAKSLAAKPAAKTKAPAAVKPAAAAAAKPAAKPAAKSVATKAASARAKAPVANAPAPKKSAAPNGKRLPKVTTFVAQCEIGWGNSLYLRGEGSPELSWERGVLMKWEDGAWVYSTTSANAPVCFKFLVNDHTWADGNNQHVDPGATSISSPHFHY